MYADIPTYRERLDELTEQLREHGHLGLVLIDASELAQVENNYGSKAFERVLSMLSQIVDELHGAEVRADDRLALNDHGGSAFLLFLSPHRPGTAGPARIADFETIAQRVGDSVNRKLAERIPPYLRGKPRVAVGFSIVFHNPLILPERIISGLVGEAWESVRIQRMQAEFQARCRLQDVLLGHQIHTVFQPVVDLQQPGLLGFEALSRGPAGTAQQSPLNLFAAATAAKLVLELDRHCRRCALQTARSLPRPFKLFINVVPTSMYDPDFQGASLIHLLEGLGLAPERIVLEVSELYAIEKYPLFVEALQNFTQMGFSIAVDDIGAGNANLSGLENINPRYLKFDMLLVRDIDQSHVKREMARALKAFADKMDSKIIAEGIEREGEQKVLVDLGIDYAQGYLLGRPALLETFDLSVPASTR